MDKNFWATTQGHPQLAHARVLNLAEKGWPEPQAIADIFGAKSLEKIRLEARNQLYDQLSSEDAKTLAYTLSIFGRPFRRDHALLLATESSSISRPGEAFDRLVGPWVERLTDQYYRISPLLDAAAQEIWPVQKLRELHAAVANVLLACKPISMLEVSGMLLHGLLGKAVSPLMATVNSLVFTKKSILPQVYQELNWFTWLALEPTQKLFAEDITVSFCLRLLQFRVATAVENKNAAVRVAEAWKEEIESIDEHEIKSSMQVIFLLETLISFRAPFSQKTIVSHIIEATNAIKNVSEFLDVTLMHFAIARCDTAEVFEGLVAALEEQPVDIRKKLLSQLNTDDGYVSQLFVSILFRRLDTQPSEWTRFITVCKRIVGLSSSLQMYSLMVAAYRAIAIVQEEYLNDTNAALSTLDECQEKLRRKHPVAEDYRATIFFRQMRYNDALSIWQIILPKWRQGINTPRVFSYRHAEICAAQLGEWAKAADFALQGEQSAKGVGFFIMAAGFRADYAFALWKSGNKAGAIESFAKVLDTFQQLPAPQTDLQSYALQKRVGHALTYLEQSITGTNELAEPIAGFFSNLDVDERIKEYPIGPPVFLWCFLAEIEQIVQSGDVIFKHFERESKKWLYHFLIPK